MPPVADPTWYSDIRFMFTPTDIQHMQAQGIDLTSYDVVVQKSGDIYGQVAAGFMPPGQPWTTYHPDWITTFLTWMTNNCPKGTDPGPSQTVSSVAAKAAASAATRIRKNVTSLSAQELDTLKTAFAAIIAKPASDPNSFFAQAGTHWLPNAGFCQHHVPAYNPWHRAYLLGFENALRSVPGCENVTLPYWDITQPFPDVLKQPPFDSYTLPQGVGQGFDQGYQTTRFSYDTIKQNLQDMDVTGDINRALSKTDWEDFHGLFAGAPNNTIISAHDSGHDAIGDTMSNPLVAAFDPVFFFFHANWDRLWWKWQTKMQATSLNGLLTTINKTADPLSYQTFTIPVLEKLAPFTSNTVATVDSAGSLDVDYEDLEAGLAVASTAKTLLRSTASKKFSVADDRVNVRVDGINRLKIPGSFKVHLLKDGKRIATRGFFQPAEADKCETCVKNAIAHFDFELPLATVSKGKLEVAVEPMDKSVVGDRFPNKLMGDPTVSVHLLMKNE